ncbi:MAG: hypothetical protein JJU05_09290 [Verrucomicrobia bacterium]|nr:hypothetical protein [Verrucomicrobiota bacterium]MCH8527596.1 M12 family metallo-peptidase [Kiritimatiellia bacterium]
MNTKLNASRLFRALFLPLLFLAASPLRVAAGDPDPIRIDILVVYTPAVKAFYEGENGVIAQVLATFEGSNAVLENSEIPMVWNVVGIEEVNYVENSFSLAVDLDNLQDPNLTALEEVHAMRDAYGADLVSLFRRGTVGGIAGLAYRLHGETPQQSFGFSVVADETAMSNFTFAHEIGHNLSSGHHRGDSSGGNPELSTSFGYRFTGTDNIDYRTVMTTGSGFIRIPNFSNPNVSFAGVPTGLPATDPLPADNATSFQSVGAQVENFRTAQPALPEIIADPPGTTLVTGNPLILETLVKGLPPLSFSWYAGQSGDLSSPLTGAEERVLRVDPVTATQTFWMRAANDGGTADSGTVRVVVVPPPAGPHTLQLEQPEAGSGFGIDDSPLWQEIIPTAGYIDEITVRLFKAGSPPDPEVSLSTVSGGELFRSGIPVGSVTGSSTLITVPVRVFVVPGQTYRLTLHPVGGEDEANRVFWQGAENTVNPGNGVGVSSIDFLNDWAFTFAVFGSEATTYHRWLQEEGIPFDQSGVGDSSGPDGLSNLLRYSLGASLSATQPEALPAAGEIVGQGAGAYLPVRYTLRKNMADVALVVEVSEDLADWEPLAEEFIFSLGDVDSQTEAWEARLPLDIGDRGFVGFRLLNPPPADMP